MKQRQPIDPFIDAIHRRRERTLAQFGGVLEAVAADAARRQAAGDWPVWKPEDRGDSGDGAADDAFAC